MPNDVGRVVFIGAVHEALPALEALVSMAGLEVVAVITASETGGSALAGPVDLASVADRAGIELHRTEDVNSPASIAVVTGLAPDLIVVVGWSRLIGKELLDLPRFGVVGFHASLLPRHRGRAPVNWSLIKGESVTGNTMMLLAEGADEGGIIDQRRIPIFIDDTCATLYDRVGASGADMLRANMPALLAGSVRPRAQNGSEADYLPKRTPAMGIVDWDRPPLDVHNWVRALTYPYPGAFSDLDGSRVCIWATEPPTFHPASGHPGEILEVSERGVRVAVQSGSVLVTRAGTDPGGSALDWAAQAGIVPGRRFVLPRSEVALWSRGEGPKPSSQVGTP